MANNPADSEDLLERARAGDREALNALFSRHRDRLCRMVETRLDPRLQARLDASDVIQDAYVEVVERLPEVWDAQTGNELLTIQGGGTNLAYSPDGKHLASRRAGVVKVWDAQTGQERLSLKVGAWDFIPSSRVAFSPDSKRLAIADDKTVKVWDAQSGQEILFLKGHTTLINCIAFSPDGKRIASGSEGAWDDTKNDVVGRGTPGMSGAWPSAQTVNGWSVRAEEG
jgi:hypothetical protein